MSRQYLLNECGSCTRHADNKDRDSAWIVCDRSEGKANAVKDGDEVRDVLIKVIWVEDGLSGIVGPLVSLKGVSVLSDGLVELSKRVLQLRTGLQWSGAV